MTVLCPSCFTRYRYEPPVHAAAALAECTRCDERFPLRETLRTYVVLPPAPLRQAAAAKQPHVDRPAPFEELVPSAGEELAARPAPAASAPTPPPLAAVAPCSDPELPAADFDLRPQDLAEFDIPAPPAAQAAPRSALLEFLIAVVPPTVGASLAYHLASRDQLDPVAWSALGGAAGFLLGWGCLLWIRRKD